MSEKNLDAKSKLLDGLTILDFSSRLPGPLAGHILSQLGAQVIKIESTHYRDPFKTLHLSDHDIAFQSWYKNFNKNKEHFTLDPDQEESRDALAALLKKAHMVIMGWPEKIQAQYHLQFAEVSQQSNWGGFVELIGSHDHKRPLHDLNIMAESGLLSLHIKESEKRKKSKRISPPFLPIAGISFAHFIVQKVLAATMKGMKDQIWVHERISLEQAIDNTIAPLFAADLQGVQDSFLHSGRYPCYNIYPLKNHRGYLAVACIEEKYWQEFTAAFALDLKVEQRFQDSDEEVFGLIQNALAQYDIEQMQEKLKELNCCLSLVLPA
jgi:alpha-methylacyl-CoA racemase